MQSIQHDMQYAYIQNKKPDLFAVFYVQGA